MCGSKKKRKGLREDCACAWHMHLRMHAVVSCVLCPACIQRVGRAFPCLCRLLPVCRVPRPAVVPVVRRPCRVPRPVLIRRVRLLCPCRAILALVSACESNQKILHTTIQPFFLCSGWRLASFYTRCKSRAKRRQAKKRHENQYLHIIWGIKESNEGPYGHDTPAPTAVPHTRPCPCTHT